MTEDTRVDTAHACPLILASTSPRRRQLMREYGYEFEIVAPPDDESDDLSSGDSPAELAQAISQFKARSAQSLVDQGMILSGDTIVALSGRIYGKPADRKDARTIIEALSGTTHDVITGVTLLDAATDNAIVRHDSTAITMKPLSSEEVEAYLDTNAWEGKAGAYGIQDYGDAFVTRIEGSFTNVVGFPMELVTRMLAAWNIQPSRKPQADNP